MPTSSQVSAETLATLSALEVRAATAASERAGTSIRAHCRSADRTLTPSPPNEVFGAGPNVNQTMSRIHTPPRRAIGLGVVVALIGAAAVALLVSGCGGTTPLETIFEAPTELWENPGPTLDELKRLGVGRVKVFMHWADVAPDPTSHTQPHFDASSPAAYPA